MKLIKSIAIIAFALVSGVVFAAAPGKVSVDSVDGKAYVVANGKVKPLAVGDVLTQGVRIASDADSKVRVVLGNGTVLVLTPKTEIVVARFEQNNPAAVDGMDFSAFTAEPAETSGSLTTIQVLRGKVLFDVAKLLPSSRFVLKTAHGSLQIKGTSGFVETSASGSSFGLVDGSATVTSSGASSISLRGGQSLSVSASGARSVRPVTANMGKQIKDELEDGSTPTLSAGAGSSEGGVAELPPFPTVGGSNADAVQNSSTDSPASL